MLGDNAHRRIPIKVSGIENGHIRLFQRGEIAGGVQRKTIAGAQQPRPLGANVQMKASSIMIFFIILLSFLFLFVI